MFGSEQLPPGSAAQVAGFVLLSSKSHFISVNAAVSLSMLNFAKSEQRVAEEENGCFSFSYIRHILSLIL